MLGVSTVEIQKWLFLLLIVTVWCGPALAAEVQPEDAARGEVIALYSNLGQNIEEEAKLYSKYSDYRENFRLEFFWKELKGLNLARDEIIMTIRLLERSLEGKVSESVYAGTGSLPIASGSDYLSGFFSNWRPFYFLISGGFFLIISSLLVMSICITCRRNVIAFLVGSFKQLISDDINGLTKMASYDCCDADILRDKDSGLRKAA